MFLHIHMYARTSHEGKTVLSESLNGTSLHSQGSFGHLSEDEEGDSSPRLTVGHQASCGKTPKESR